MESSMATLLFIALLSERLVEIAKIFIKPFTENWNKARLSAMWQFLGLFSGIVLAFGLQINFLSIVGIKEAPWLGKLLAGIFAGMGTQWVHELITNLPYEIARSHRAQAELRKCTESRKKGLRLEFHGAAPGMNVSWERLKERVEATPEEWFADFCRVCDWLKLCEKYRNTL